MKKLFKVKIKHLKLWTSKGLTGTWTEKFSMGVGLRWPMGGNVVWPSTNHNRPENFNKIGLSVRSVEYTSNTWFWRNLENWAVFEVGLPQEWKVVGVRKICLFYVFEMIEKFFTTFDSKISKFEDFHAIFMASSKHPIKYPQIECRNRTIHVQNIAWPQTEWNYYYKINWWLWSVVNAHSIHVIERYSY